MIKRVFIIAMATLMACAAPEQKAQEQATSTPVVEGEAIELLEVAPTGGASINEALWARKSSRDFTAEPLSLEELSGVVWAAAGINRPENDHLTAPSALALYPIKLYAFLEGGAYLYDAKAHKLMRVAEGDNRPLTAMQEFAFAAPLNLVYVADTQAYEGKNIPQPKLSILCSLDAAGYAENVNLYAAAHNLKAITRGSYNEAALLELLGLDSSRYFVALAQTVGK